MAQQAPWSIKGVDAATREQMKQLAQETGVTLAELISDLLDKNQQKLMKNTQASASVKKKTDSLKTARVPAVKVAVKEEVKAKAKPVPAKAKLAQKAVAKKTIAKKAVDNKAARKTKVKSSSYPLHEIEAEKPSVFATLMKLHTGEMPAIIEDTQQDFDKIVYDSRTLRDALRVHTQELSKEIQSEVNRTILQSLEKLQYTVGTSSAETPAVNMQHLVQETQAIVCDAFKEYNQGIQVCLENLQQQQKQETDSLRHEVQGLLHEAPHMNMQHLVQETQTIVFDAFKEYNQGIQICLENLQQQQKQETDSFRHEVQGFIHETVANLSQSLEEKINVDVHDFITDTVSNLSLSVETQINKIFVQHLSNVDSDPQQALHISALHQSIEKIITRLIPLEQTCYNLQSHLEKGISVQHSADGQGHEQISHLHQELSGFLQEIPHKIQALFAQSQNDNESLKQSLKELARKVELIEDYTHKLPLAASISTPIMDNTRKSSPMVASASFVKTELPHKPEERVQHLSASQHTNISSDSFLDDEFDTVSLDNLSSLELEMPLAQKPVSTNMPFANTTPQATIREAKKPFENKSLESFQEEDLYSLDEWSEDETMYDELGFEQKIKKEVLTPKTNVQPQSRIDAQDDIRAMDRDILRKARRDASQKLSQKELNLKENPPSFIDGLLESVSGRNGKRNALLLGGGVLSIVGLLTAIALI